MRVRALLSGAALLVLHAPLYCQTGTRQAAPAVSVEHGLDLAQRGRCAEAMPVLEKAKGRVEDKDLKRSLGVAGVRCAMTLGDKSNATLFINWLDREFPHDPEVLYLSIHVYSDLSLRASQELMYTAPGSPQVHQINGESLETQGKLKEAMEEYRIVLDRAPSMHGIHFRIARLILSQPTTPTGIADARKEIEEELKIDPENAGAEYVLGELDRQSDHLSQAIEHFRRAATLDAGFGDAFLSLGRALLELDHVEEAVGPLETAVKLQPDNPTDHFTLATAYQRLGRQADAAREIALHKSTTEKARAAAESVRHGISGGPPDESRPPATH
jgi:Tfp pilus assembly protein PilF